MASCRNCGAPIVFAQLTDADERENPARVILDRHEAAFGPGRYAIWDDGSCRPVAAGAQVLAHPVHVCSPPMPR